MLEETDCEKCNEKQEDKPEEAKDTVNNNTVKDSNPQIVKYDSINDVLKKILGK
ncbi:MAG TPA: hypothetical protein PK390_03840 [Fervidobacterium nodosum]|nr:hypothetical protein [Fervidobacterium nodosum]